MLSWEYVLGQMTSILRLLSRIGLDVRTRLDFRFPLIGRIEHV